MISAEDAIGVLLEELANRVATAVAERLRAPVPTMVSQHGSPLGRKHNGVVRRRLGRNEPGASIVGRLHYLSHEALAEELGRLSSQIVSKPEPTATRGENIRSRLERELRGMREGRQTSRGA
jgi:hypothetical protein